MCLLAFLVSGQAQAICVKNKTDFLLYYEIQNRNGCPAPKVKFHSGYLQGKQKKCYAHSADEGSDWKIYRNDLIKVFKVNDKNQRVPACTKTVMGIMNTLSVSQQSWDGYWWCLDRSDDED